MYDEEDNGYIDLVNLRMVANELGFEDTVTDIDCLSMIKVADSKNLNAVDYDDFMLIM